MTLPYLAPVLDWYSASARDLPWRAATATPWSVLVSEVMLQQTPVSRVLPAHRAWLARWPSPAALAADPPAAAVRQWGRLGYPRRALRLHEAAGQDEEPAPPVGVRVSRPGVITIDLQSHMESMPLDMRTT